MGPFLGWQPSRLRLGYSPGFRRFEATDNREALYAFQTAVRSKPAYGHASRAMCRHHGPGRLNEPCPPLGMAFFVLGEPFKTAARFSSFSAAAIDR